MYPVIVWPPLLDGALNATDVNPLLKALPDGELVAVGADIVSGTVVGVAEELEEDAKDAPFAFVAVTVKVYAVSLVKPETVIGEDEDVPVIPPGDEVAVYDDIALPPVLFAVTGTEIFAVEPNAWPVGLVGLPTVGA